MFRLADYVQHLLTYIDVKKLKPLKLVVNAGNGAAGHVVDAIEKNLNVKVPVTFIKSTNNLWWYFPNGSNFCCQ